MFSDDAPASSSLARRDKYEQCYREPPRDRELSEQDKALRKMREKLQTTITALKAANYTLKRRYRAALSLLPPETSDELRRRIRNPLKPDRRRLTPAEKLSRSELVRLVNLCLTMGLFEESEGKVDLVNNF